MSTHPKVDLEQIISQFSNWFALNGLKELDQIEPGEGGIIKSEGKLLAAYRNLNGSVETISATCPKLGGALRWNKAEKKWECPCHGLTRTSN